MFPQELLLTMSVFHFLLTTAWASDVSIGSNGINSAVLKSAPYNLTGADIGIGQVEPGRPGVAGEEDPSTGLEYFHQDVIPTAVFHQNQSAITDDASPHGVQVAGIMVSKNTGSVEGIAPDAKLYSSALATDSPTSVEYLSTIQHIASRNGGDVRAMNHSYFIPLGGLDSPDGNSDFTLGMDWSASGHNVLHMVSGQNFGSDPLPKDNYNGMTIARSERDENGVFRIVDEANNFIDVINADRGWIDLIAPVRDIALTSFDSETITDSGTSFAAPHVTGTVALLQEFADDKLNNEQSINWSGTPGTANANRHEVMKAVLLNSADKLAGVHGSTRTVESRDATGNYNWLASPAALDVEIPLDREFGAGHLNAEKALKQFENGEWEPFADIPLIGWDLGETGGPGTTLRYPFAEPLSAGGYIALTLTWDREVFKTGSETTYNTFDQFTDLGVSDLDLYLLPEGWTDLNQAAERRSISFVENVEHVFAEIPVSGNYEIVVTQGSGGDEEFALAWWYGNPVPSTQTGDFNGDGAVNGKDFLAWQRGESPTPYSSSDLADWQTAYNGGAISATTAVPEPNSLLLLLTAMMFVRSTRCISAN